MHEPPARFGTNRPLIEVGGEAHLMAQAYLMSESE